MTDLSVLALQAPATGDNFPVVPLLIIAGIAVVIAIVSTVLAKKKK